MSLDIDKTFKALADKNRRQMLVLLKQQDLTAGEIAEEFKISKPSISHHLKALKNANLVESRREGQQIYYSLRMTVFQEVVSQFMDLFRKESGNDDEI